MNPALQGISYCGILLVGDGRDHVTIKKKTPGWKYRHCIEIHQEIRGTEDYEVLRLFIGLVDVHQYRIVMSFWQQNQNLEIYSWLKELAPAISNVYLYSDVPDEYQVDALKLPAIGCVGLRRPSRVVMQEVNELSSLHTLNISIPEELAESLAEDMVHMVVGTRAKQINITCKCQSNSTCGVASLLLCEKAFFERARCCFKITGISCPHILNYPLRSVFPMMISLKRLEIFRGLPDIEPLLPMLTPPLEVELRDEFSEPDLAAKIGPAVTVFESNIIELSLDQIHALRVCTGMKELSVVYPEGLDWHLSRTITGMPDLRRLRILGDDSSEDINDPVVKAAPNAMWFAVKSLPKLTNLSFNTLLIPSSEIERIFRAIGRRLESFSYGIWKQEKPPDEKFIDIMLIAAKHCGGMDSHLRYLGVPRPEYMNVQKGDISPITEQRRNSFWNAAITVMSSCSNLEEKGIALAWKIIRFCERNPNGSLADESRTIAWE